MQDLAESTVTEVESAKSLMSIDTATDIVAYSGRLGGVLCVCGVFK